MQKKKAKKSWVKGDIKNNPNGYCLCDHCTGEHRIYERRLKKTRVRKKYSKHPQKDFEE